MKRILLLTPVLAAALLLPSSASARIIELGGTADAASLNCPGTTEAPWVAPPSGPVSTPYGPM